MAKQDRRQRSEAAKAATRAARLARASSRRRVISWSTAASAAEVVGCPLNVALSVTWSALVHGDRRAGHVLGLGPVERERRLWSALRLVAARAGVSWLAARGPEYDRQRGLHLHLVMHLPDIPAIRDALGVVERITGAPAAWIDPAGRTLRGGGRRHHGVIGISACGGWLVQRHLETKGGDGLAIAAYSAKGDGKAAVEGQHRLSNELSGLVKRHRAAQRGAVGAPDGHLSISAVVHRKTSGGPVRRSMALFRHTGRFDIHSKNFKAEADHA